MQDGKVLCENADDCSWYAKDVFKFKIDGKCTLIDKREIKNNN